MDVQAPSAQTTLLILLGASAWPFSPEFQSSEAFANAARRVKAYFLNVRPFGLPAENLLDLFDSDKSPDELDVAIMRASIFPRWAGIVLILSSIEHVLTFTPLSTVLGPTFGIIVAVGFNTLFCVALVGCGLVLLSRHKVLAV